MHASVPFWAASLPVFPDTTKHRRDPRVFITQGSVVIARKDGAAFSKTDFRVIETAQESFA